MKKQLSPQNSTFPKAEWRIWLWGIILFLVLLMVIKEASNFSKKEVAEKVVAFNEIDALPSFPSGERAFGSYLQQHIHNNSAAKGRVIVSFVVNKNGSIKM